MFPPGSSSGGFLMALIPIVLHTLVLTDLTSVWKKEPRDVLWEASPCIEVRHSFNSVSECYLGTLQRRSESCLTSSICIFGSLSICCSVGGRIPQCRRTFSPCMWCPKLPWVNWSLACLTGEVSSDLHPSIPTVLNSLHYEFRLKISILCVFITCVCVLHMQAWEG